MAALSDSPLVLGVSLVSMDTMGSILLSEQSLKYSISRSQPSSSAPTLKSYSGYSNGCSPSRGNSFSTYYLINSMISGSFGKASMCASSRAL